MVNQETQTGQTVIWDNNPEDLQVSMKTGTLRREVLFWTADDLATLPGSGHQFKNISFDIPESQTGLELLLIYIGRGKSSLDLNLYVNHLAPHTRSRITLKALLWGESRLNFLGNIHVSQKAVKTDTFMRCDSLILSPSAKSRTIPSLEIIANDVKAGHAATTGKINESVLFYLRTRGFSEQEARKLLVEAFVSESVKAFTGLGEADLSELRQKLSGISGKIVL